MAKRKVVEPEPDPNESDGTVEDVAVEEPEPDIEPDPKKHIYVDLGQTGEYALMDLPDEEEPKQRRLTVQGKNVEHVGNGRNNVWQYRHM